jgi:hypothetical protein
MAMSRPRRTTRWTPAVVPVGILMMLLGAWAFFAPLVGPYFNYGFFTSTTWMFSARHWELLLGPGLAIFAGGLLLAMPARGLGWLGGLLGLVGSVWLLVGPSVYPLWTAGGHVHILTLHVQWMRTLLWIGYFYGAGAVGVYLSAVAHGLLGRRTVVEEEPVIHETPVDRRERVITRV